MQEMIRVHTSDNYEQTVSARELHEKLGIIKHFTQWWDSQKNQLFLLDGIDFLTLRLESTGGRPSIDYQIPIDTAKHLAMISGGEKAHEIRQYFIKVEKAWNDPEMVMVRAQQIAQRKLLSYEEKVKHLETRIEIDKPKVLFADAVSSSKSSILVFDLAKLLKQNGIDIGGHRLFGWLRDNGYLIKRKGADYNMPTQRSMEMNLFEIKESSVCHSDGHTSISRTPKVTGKGQIYFINKFSIKEDYQND